MNEVLAAAAAPDLKDAMVAIVGAAVALGGLLLIFVGFLFGQASTLANSSPPASKDYVNRFRSVARQGLWPFAVSLAVAILAAMYWIVPSDPYARFVIASFAGATVYAIIYGFRATDSL